MESAREKCGTASFARRLIGEHEVIRLHESQSTDRMTSRSRERAANSM
jgi:hypothetical protein